VSLVAPVDGDQECCQRFDYARHLEATGVDAAQSLDSADQGRGARLVGATVAGDQHVLRERVVEVAEHGGADCVERSDDRDTLGHELLRLLRRGSLPDPQHPRRPPADRRGERDGGVEQQLALAHALGDMGDRLLVAAEGNTEHDQLVGGCRGSVLEPVDAAARGGGEHALRRLLCARLLARADRHLDTGGGQSHGPTRSRVHPTRQ